MNKPITSKHILFPDPGCYELAKKPTSSKENQSADNPIKSFRNSEK